MDPGHDTRTLLLGAGILSVTVFGMSPGAAQPVLPGVQNVLQKDSVTILVTDSGLGGLAVVADMEQRSRGGIAPRVLRLVFCNALPETGQGYNRMPSSARKAEVFSSALEGMSRLFHPDLLLIGCNTLSVVYPETRFARTAPFPVIGIVDLGIRLLVERLGSSPGSAAVIFGTETTIESDAHRRGLMALGIPPDRITTQACPDLAGEIESDARSERVEAAIDLFAEDAAGRVPGDADTLLAGLCCTHYGYCGDTFAAALSTHSGKPVEVIDPTQHMSRLIFPEAGPKKHNETRVSVAVVSRAVLTPEEISSICGLLEPVSPATAEALRHYTLQRDLFPYEPEQH